MFLIKINKINIETASVIIWNLIFNTSVKIANYIFVN